MHEATQQLRAYYEAEAQLRARPRLSASRVALVDEFIALLRAEGCSSVVDVGSGPGRDGERFVAADLSWVGVDLAFGNALLAAEGGLRVTQADLAALPFRRASFDAGLSMSTLMHLPEEQMATAVREMAAVLRPGAPLLVGMWGGDAGDVVSQEGIEGYSRLFSLRSHERNAALLASGGDVEWSTTWHYGDGSWTYHVFRLRVGGLGERQ